MYKLITGLHLAFFLLEFLMQILVSVIYIKDFVLFIICMCVIGFSSIVINTVSLVKILRTMDFNGTKHGMIVCIICHIFQVGVIWRCTKIALSKESVKEDISEIHILSVIRSSIQNGPILIICLNVIVSNVRVSPLGVVFAIVTIGIFVFSYVCFSRHNMQKCDTYNTNSSQSNFTKDTFEIKTCCDTSLINDILARLFLLCSRSLAAALFIQTSGVWIFLIIGLHSILFSLFIYIRRSLTHAAQAPHIKDIFINLIHVFDFIYLRVDISKCEQITYYVLVGIENTIMAVIWFVSNEPNLRNCLLFSCVMICFAGGIIFTWINRWCVKEANDIKDCCVCFGNHETVVVHIEPSDETECKQISKLPSDIKFGYSEANNNFRTVITDPHSYITETVVPDIVQQNQDTSIIVHSKSLPCTPCASMRQSQSQELGRHDSIHTYANEKRECISELLHFGSCTFSCNKTDMSHDQGYCSRSGYGDTSGSSLTGDTISVQTKSKLLSRSLRVANRDCFDLHLPTDNDPDMKEISDILKTIDRVRESKFAIRHEMGSGYFYDSSGGENPPVKPRTYIKTTCTSTNETNIAAPDHNSAPAPIAKNVTVERTESFLSGVHTKSRYDFHETKSLPGNFGTESDISSECDSPATERMHFSINRKSKSEANSCVCSDSSSDFSIMRGRRSRFSKRRQSVPNISRFRSYEYSSQEISTHSNNNHTAPAAKNNLFASPTCYSDTFKALNVSGTTISNSRSKEDIYLEDTSISIDDDFRQRSYLTTPTSLCSCSCCDEQFSRSVLISRENTYYSSDTDSWSRSRYYNRREYYTESSDFSSCTDTFSLLDSEYDFTMTWPPARKIAIENLSNLPKKSISPRENVISWLDKLVPEVCEKPTQKHDVTDSGNDSGSQTHHPVLGRRHTMKMDMKLMDLATYREKCAKQTTHTYHRYGATSPFLPMQKFKKHKASTSKNFFVKLCSVHRGKPKKLFPYNVSGAKSNVDISKGISGIETQV